MKLVIYALAGLVMVLSVSARAAGAGGLSYVPLDHWSYQALDRLATLGLLPLHALSARPITRLEAQRLVEEASARLSRAGPDVARLAQEDLRRLREEFSIEATVGVTLAGVARSGGNRWRPPGTTPDVASIALDVTAGDNLQLYGRLVESADGAPTRSEAYASLRLGSVLAQVGRSAVWWGPGFRSSLLLSDNAGTFPMLRLTADLPRVRLTKVVASLERGAGPQGSPAYLFATRLDWAVTPRFRLGVSETVVMTWDGPMSVLHAIHPLPVVFSAVASAFFHDILGQTRQTLAGVDFDWLPRPGLRLYGSLLIDDPLPLDRARVGLQAGFYMANPLGWQRTGLRLEYSLITNGTYTYYDPFYDHAYRGRSLGHWLGPDGDDLYVELTRLLGESATLQLSYSYTRKGQGSFEQPEEGSPGLFLTGVVERRHSLGIRLHKIHSPSLDTRYWLEMASVSNRGNVPGAGGLEVQAGLGATYRWPLSQSPMSSERARAAAAVLPRLAADSTGGKTTLRTWSVSVSSDRGLPPQPTAFFLGVDYRTNFGRWPLSFSVDGTPRGDHLFWSADVHHPLAVAPYGAASVFAGLGGGRFPGGVGPMPETVAYTGPRGGLEFRYQVPLSARAHSLSLAGQASTNLRWTFAQVYLWDYSLGAGWAGPGLGVEIGYRGIAAMWQPRTPDQTSLLWEGIYLTVSIR